MSKRLLSALLLSCVAGLAAPSLAPAGIGDATLSIDVSKHAIDYGKGVRIKGDLEGELLGDADRTIELRAKPYPYTSEQVVDTTTTDASGGYSFNMEPDYNTRYRVTEQGGSNAASKERQVYVFGVGTFRISVRPYSHISSKFRMRYSPQLPTAMHHRKYFIYMRKTTQRKFHPMDSTHTRRLKPGKIGADSSFARPPGSYRYFLFWCLEIPTDERDVGIGTPTRHDCPRNPFIPNRFYGDHDNERSTTGLKAFEAR